MFHFSTVQNRRGTDSLKWDGAPGNTIPLWIADMDFKCPNPILESLQNMITHGILGYSIVSQNYFDAVIQWVKKQYLGSLTAENILPVTGIIPALRAIIEEFTVEQDYIIIQPPVYYPFMEVIRESNRREGLNPLIYDQTGRYYIDMDQLQSLRDLKPKMLILCSPHNPVGRVWSRAELVAIGHFCLEQNILLVVDEIHGDFIMPGHEFVSFLSFSQEILKNCIVLSSPTKTFNFAGLRGGNVFIFNPMIKEALIRRFTRMGIDKVNSFYIKAAIAGYNMCYPWLKQLIEYLYQNYHYVKSFVAQYIPLLIVAPLEATYLVWIDYRGLNISEPTLIEALSRELTVSEGSKFGIHGEGHIRLNIACPLTTICDAMKVLKKTIDLLQN